MARETEPKYYKNPDGYLDHRPGYICETWDRKAGLHNTMKQYTATWDGWAPYNMDIRIKKTIMPMLYNADLTVGQVKVVDRTIIKK